MSLRKLFADYLYQTGTRVTLMVGGQTLKSTMESPLETQVQDTSAQRISVFLFQ